MFLNSLSRSYFSSNAKLNSSSFRFSYNSSITLMWYLLSLNLSERPSPTLNNNEYFFSHSSGKIPSVPSPSCTNDCLPASAFLISAMPTRCSPNSISTFASNQSNPLLTWMWVLGLAVLNLKFLSASNPNTGTFKSFMASTKRKNQLLRSTSAPLSTRLPVLGCSTKEECSRSIFCKNFSSSILFLRMIKILSSSKMVMVSLSPGLVSKPL